MLASNYGGLFEQCVIWKGMDTKQISPVLSDLLYLHESSCFKDGSCLIFVLLWSDCVIFIHILPVSILQSELLYWQVSVSTAPWRKLRQAGWCLRREIQFSLANWIVLLKICLLYWGFSVLFLSMLDLGLWLQDIWFPKD